MRTGGVGVKKWLFFADVLYGQPLSGAHERRELELAKQLAVDASGDRPTAIQSTSQSEINKYFMEVRNSIPVCNSSMFWQERRKMNPQLTPLAEGLVSAMTALASQAFVKRIFFVCGMLTKERRNGMDTSLEMRVSLNSMLMS